MKKTLRTVITAAMFAAANMAALPASAEEQKSFEGVSPSEFNRWEDITGQIGQMVYGPGPNFDLNDHSNDWKQTTTTTDDDVKTTTTTTSWNPDFHTTHTTTTTEPWFNDVQLLYGPTTPVAVKLEHFGDLNMDGNVDGFDMIALRKLLIGNYYGKNVNYSDVKFNADLNHDNKVSIADLLLLQRYLLGEVKDLKTGETNYWNIELEQVTESTTTRKRGHFEATTTTTAVTSEDELPFYDPREDIIVTLYGIKPAQDIIDQAVFETKENIDTQLSSEDE